MKLLTKNLPITHAKNGTHYLGAWGQLLDGEAGASYDVKTCSVFSCVVSFRARINYITITHTLPETTGRLMLISWSFPEMPIRVPNTHHGQCHLL